MILSKLKSCEFDSRKVAVDVVNNWLKHQLRKESWDVIDQAVLMHDIQEALDELKQELDLRDRIIARLIEQRDSHSDIVACMSKNTRVEKVLTWEATMRLDNMEIEKLINEAREK